MFIKSKIKKVQELNNEIKELSEESKRIKKELKNVVKTLNETGWTKSSDVARKNQLTCKHDYILEKLREEKCLSLPLWHYEGVGTGVNKIEHEIVKNISETVILVCKKCGHVIEKLV